MSTAIKPSNIVAVAGDPGGANALAPVLQQLRAKGHRLTALAYGQARDLWRRRDIPVQELDGYLTAGDARQRLETLKADRLLVGSSFNPLNLERTFVAGARLAGIPSLAVLDFWSNYTLRFGEGAVNPANLPDGIAIMDEQARREMMAEGFPAERLRVTGQPAFDDLARLRAEHSQEQRRAMRASLGITDGRPLVLFASQPLAALFGTNTQNPLFNGYTEHTVLTGLIRALENIGQGRQQQLALVIRSHPRENPDDLRRPSTDHVTITVDSQGEARSVALAADLVTGMTTVLLVEACLLGCAVVSLQPATRLPDMLPTNRWGASRAVYAESDFESALDALLFDAAARSQLLERAASFRVEPGATGRVIALLESLPMLKGGE